MVVRIRSKVGDQARICEYGSRLDDQACSGLDLLEDCCHEPRITNYMRLSNQTQNIIRDTVYEVFGSDAAIIVFGSRIDDTARGGDIDLLVQLGKPIQQRERKVLQLVARLQIRLGDQPIDVLVVDPETVHQPVHKEAIRTGVRL